MSNKSLIQPCVVGCGLPANPTSALHADMVSVIDQYIPPFNKRWNIPTIDTSLYYTNKSIHSPTIGKPKRNKKKCKISKLSRRRNRNGR